jgi:5'-nucleotidase
VSVLLSNDDGISAVGLSILEKSVRSFTDDRVVVVAPDLNMSGSGHSLTLWNPLRLTEHDPDHFSVNGTPVDCMIMALEHIADQKPDIVLSGINNDANLSDDVLYSGTVAVAEEACARGIPSVAFSQNVKNGRKIDWEVAEKYTPIVLKVIMKNFEFSKGIFLNINFPACDVGDVKGIKITSHGSRPLDNNIEKLTDPRNRQYFWIGTDDYRRNEDHSDTETDLWAVYNGYVSITPMSLDRTDKNSITTLERLFQ